MFSEHKRKPSGHNSDLMGFFNMQDHNGLDSWANLQNVAQGPHLRVRAALCHGFREHTLT